MKRNILFVDDDPTSGRILQAVLTQAGYYVSIANDGFQALEMLEKYAFDLVLLDIMMPQMSGFDLLKRLRLTPSGKSIPIIMLTAMDDPNSVRKARDLGADDYLLKPPQKEALLSKIENLLGGRPRFAEVSFGHQEKEVHSELVFACRIVSIGESGVVMHSAISLQPDTIHLVRAPIFTKIGVESPCLKVIESLPDKEGYLNYFSYLGLSDAEVRCIREWVIEHHLRKRSA